MRSLFPICFVFVFLLSGCNSWVFAKSEFNEMPKGTYKLDLTHASLAWKVSHLGLSEYLARFTRFDAQIDFDPINVENSSVTASIDPTSIATAFPNSEQQDFNQTLATDKNWFNANKFPTIDFQSTEITMASPRVALMKGNLTFLGITKTVVLNVIFNGAMMYQPFSKKPTLGFSAEGLLDRKEWGMTKYVPNIGEEVKVMIEGEFALVKED